MKKSIFKGVVSLIITIVVLTSCVCQFSVSASEEKAIISIGDQKIEAVVGEEIAYTVRLYTKTGVDIVSADVNYNPDMLSWIEEPTAECLPMLEQPFIIHKEDKGMITFNASAQSEIYSFSKNQVLVTLRFTVKSEGESDISIFFKQLYGANYNIVAKNGVFYNDSIAVSESVSHQPEARYLYISHDGEMFTAHDGDVITYVVYLDSPEKIARLNGEVMYDRRYLYLEETTVQQMFPNVRAGDPYHVEGGVQFTGDVNGKGFNTSEPEVLAKLDFRIVGEGWTKIEVTRDLYTYKNGGLLRYDDAGVKLSSVITIKNEGARLLGDANCDGEVNIRDATAIQKHLVGLGKLTDEAKLPGDADCDGKLSVKDATAIQKYIAGIQIPYAINEPIEA